MGHNVEQSISSLLFLKITKAVSLLKKVIDAVLTERLHTKNIILLAFSYSHVDRRPLLIPITSSIRNFESVKI